MILDGEKLNKLIEKYVNGKKAERNRQILRIHYICGQTYSETAETCKVSDSTVARVIRQHGDALMMMLQKEKN